MSRNRHKRNRTKDPSRSFQSPSLSYTPASHALIQRVISGGTDYLMRNLIRIMTDSVMLVEEPEIIDIHLNGQEATEITQRWMNKYDKRLSAARIKGPDEFQEVFDEMRIKVIAELATPTFRKDVDRRLQAMLDRLSASEDLVKLEMVLLLKPLLGMKNVPWGLCGLIIAIYNRTMQQTIQAYEDEKIVYEAVLDAFESERDENIEVADVLKSPEKLEQIGQKLFSAKPGLRERVEQQIWDMLDAFEGELAKGNIKLDLFTEEELTLPFIRLQAEPGESITQVKQSEKLRDQVFKAIVDAVNSTMTPERYRHLCEDVQATAKTWMQARNRWAAAIQGELTWVEKEQYTENKFILSAFLGQVMRLGKEQHLDKKR
jgi:hypothetical protein